MPKFLYGYVSGGAENDAAVRDNRKALEEYGFVPRVLNVPSLSAVSVGMPSASSGGG